jgi:hypothetical protein
MNDSQAEREKDQRIYQRLNKRPMVSLDVSEADDETPAQTRTRQRVVFEDKARQYIEAFGHAYVGQCMECERLVLSDEGGVRICPECRTSIHLEEISGIGPLLLQ